MKKSLENELMVLAHRILQLKEKDDLERLKNMAGEVYEKLSILAFTQKHFAGSQPTIGLKQVEEALQNDKTESQDSSKKEKVATPQAHKIENNLKPQQEKRNNNLNEFSVHYDDLPQFEPAKTEEVEKIKSKPSKQKSENSFDKADLFTQKTDRNYPSKNSEKIIEKQKTRNEINTQTKSLNDFLSRGLKLGLNDRLALTKHLFEGNTEDFNRVISQLNTLESYDEAKHFIEENIKPDYNWEEEAEYEERLYTIIEKAMPQ